MLIVELMKFALLTFLATSCVAAHTDQPSSQSQVSPPLVEAELPILTCKRVTDIVIENSDQEPLCVDPKRENVCLRNDISFVAALQHPEKAIFESCLIFGEPASLAALNVTLKRMPVRVDLNVEFNEKQRFAHWADQHRVLLKGLRGFATSSNFGEIVSVSQTPSPFLVQGVLDPQLMSVDFESSRSWPHAPQLLGSVTELIKYLQAGTLKEKFQGLNTTEARLLELSKNAPVTEVVETYRENACQSTCIKESDKISLGSGQTFFREYFSRGTVYRSEWVLENSDQQIVGLLYMAKSFPALFARIERHSSGVAKSIEVINRQGAVVFQKQWDISDLVKPQPIEGLVDFDSIELPKVGLCEESLVPEIFTDQHPESFILRGPRSPDSFYGWTDGSQSLSGREYVNKLSLPLDQFFLGEHSLDVAGELAQGEPVGIIPLGISACLKPRAAHDWWPSFIESGTRVINLSVRNRDDEPTCREWIRQHPIESDRESVLWVVAAGNQGVDGPNGCPQYLSGRPNIIVVGASQRGRVHPNSNYGESLVDIFANGKTFDGMAWGTSFAAPKVAKVAAVIFARFPDLTVEQVKAAILLSVEWPWRKLESRTGGVLDASSALDLAELINQKQGNIDQALQEKYGNFIISYEYEKRKELWKKIFKGEKNEE